MTHLEVLPRGYKTCKNCGEVFRANSNIQKFCIKCTTIKCKQCKTEFRHGIFNKFCSKDCYAAWMTGGPNGQRIHVDSKAKQAAHRRRKGVSMSGSPEHLEKLSRLTKLAMQRPEIQEKIRQPRGALSLERRMEISNKLKGKMPANLSYDNSGYANIQRGYFDINGTTIYFRSKWEANYALYLDFLIDHKEIYKWEFEPDTFMFEEIKLGTRSYTPDFKVFITPKKFEYHEVKGYMDSKSKTKLKRFAKYYPEHALILVDSTEYNMLKRKIGKVCKFY